MSWAEAVHIQEFSREDVSRVLDSVRHGVVLPLNEPL